MMIISTEINICAHVEGITFRDKDTWNIVKKRNYFMPNVSFFIYDVTFPKICSREYFCDVAKSHCLLFYAVRTNNTVHLLHNPVLH